jgi:hypothetical protein
VYNGAGNVRCAQSNINAVRQRTWEEVDCVVTGARYVFVLHPTQQTLRLAEVRVYGDSSSFTTCTECTLQPNEYVYSPDGVYRFSLFDAGSSSTQASCTTGARNPGDLIVEKTSQSAISSPSVTWSSRAAGVTGSKCTPNPSQGSYVQLGADGELGIYGASGAHLWSAGSGGRGVGWPQFWRFTFHTDSQQRWHRGSERLQEHDHLDNGDVVADGCCARRVIGASHLRIILQ